MNKHRGGDHKEYLDSAMEEFARDFETLQAEAEKLIDVLTSIKTGDGCFTTASTSRLAAGAISVFRSRYPKEGSSGR